MPSKVRIIDLSLPVNKTTEFLKPKVETINHVKGLSFLYLGGIINDRFLPKVFKITLFLLGLRKIKEKDFPDGHGLAWEWVRLETHHGTHVDAPWHYGYYSEGKKAKTIDQIPLEWCYSDGVVLDLRQKQEDNEITYKDLEKAEEDIKYKIKAGDIVLIMTGADKFYSEKKYLYHYPGLTKDAILWLLRKKVRIIGIDAWGMDRPFNKMIKDYFKSKNKDCLWPAHLVGRENEYCQIEKLANLDKIPVAFGFKVACFPINIEGASAGWSRVVAIIEQK